MSVHCHVVTNDSPLKSYSSYPGTSTYVHMDLLSTIVLTAFTNVAPASPIKSLVFFMGVCRTETRGQIGKVSPRNIKNKPKEKHKNLIPKSKKHGSTPPYFNELPHLWFICYGFTNVIALFWWICILLNLLLISWANHFHFTFNGANTPPPAPVMIRWTKW